MIERESLQQALTKAEKVLAILEEQVAGHTSLSVPPAKLIELDEQRKKVAELRERLQLLGPRPSLPTSTSVKSFKNLPAANPLEKHYNELMDTLVKGKLVVFLGSSINRCGREQGIEWQPGQHLPAGNELATYLADIFGCDFRDSSNLMQISQFIDVDKGYGALYEELHKLFNQNYAPNLVHEFFALLPAVLREKGFSPRPLLFVTTNYDNVLEQAFEKAGLNYDVVSYVAEGENRGKFLYWPRGSTESEVVERPNEADKISLEERSVILKIHGMVDRSEQEMDSFAITEDHHIGYLAQTEISKRLPYKLVVSLKNNSYLFLGYNLRDWNSRVILNRLWQEQRFKFTSWAVELDPQELDSKFWMKHGVKLLDIPLEEYLSNLSRHLEALPAKEERL
jgi:hypothetical protein